MDDESQSHMSDHNDAEIENQADVSGSEDLNLEQLAAIGTVGTTNNLSGAILSDSDDDAPTVPRVRRGPPYHVSIFLLCWCIVCIPTMIVQWLK